MELRTRLSRKPSLGTPAAWRGAAKSIWRAPVALALAGFLWACAGGVDAPLAPPPGPESSYRLGSGDQIRVSIFNEPNLTGEHRVDGKGMVTLPLIGPVKAEGKTADELTKLLRKRYAEFLTTPDIRLEVLNHRPFYIVGEIKNPGNYPYVSGMTVINAIAIAGGFTYRANTERFYIQRKSEKTGQFSATQTTEVQPGDVIVVRERFF